MKKEPVLKEYLVMQMNGRPVPIEAHDIHIHTSGSLLLMINDHVTYAFGPGQWANVREAATS